MKKKLLSIVLAFTILFAATIPTYATESPTDIIHTDDGSTIIYNEDGSSFIISAPYGTETQGSRTTVRTITKHKDVTYQDSDGNLVWKYTLTGTFSFDGSSSACTNASYTQSIYDSIWTFSDGSATKSGNVATGKGKFVSKFLFITVKTYNIDIHLTCDKYGNVT